MISVLANIVPKQTHDLVRKYLDGDTKGSLALQQKYLNLIHALFVEVNPIPVKEAMNQMDMSVGGYRLPLTHMTEAHKQQMNKCLKEVGLL